LSHEKSETFEYDGKHAVINTVGFRSVKAAENAAFSKKNKKRKKPVFYDTEAEATLASKERSQRTDSVRQMNSRGDGKLLPVPHNKAMHKLIKKIRESKNNGR
jgi:hypothetical protein